MSTQPASEPPGSSRQPGAPEGQAGPSVEDADFTAGRLLISALEHFAYCPRQAALIHLDGTFTDDVRTTQGSLAHQSVDTPNHSRRPLPPPERGIRRVTALPVWSAQYGLYGICDVVEFTTSGVPAPVEHKVGPYRDRGPSDIQVAAQAMCLTEMLGVNVMTGYIYSYADRRRHPVPITAALLERTHQVIDDTRAMLTRADLPLPVSDHRCRRCSLQEECLPALTSTTVNRLFIPLPLGTWGDIDD